MYEDRIFKGNARWARGKGEDMPWTLDALRLDFDFDFDFGSAENRIRLCA